MFINATTLGSTKIEEKLLELKLSEFQFALTGSRLFKPHFRDAKNKTKDYDFFTKYTPEVERYLEILGFKKQSNSIYKDSLTVKVMRCVCEYTHIDVQLVLNFELKLKIQNLILDSGMMSIMKTKDDERRLWDLMLKATLEKG